MTLPPAHGRTEADSRPRTGSVEGHPQAVPITVYQCPYDQTLLWLPQADGTFDRLVTECDLCKRKLVIEPLAWQLRSLATKLATLHDRLSAMEGANAPT